MSASFTFRVSNIPARITSSALPGFLGTVVPDLGDDDNIHVHSLAPDPQELSGSGLKIATVDFSQIPKPFSLPGQRRWVFRLGNADRSLVIDKDFIGFTPMNTVMPDEHVADCIAVHGLAGHPFGSWRQRTNRTGTEQFMWLRDQLPKDVSGLRVMLYGYDTKLEDSLSFQDIGHLALAFTTNLDNVGASEASSKPLIILAHSLGGLLVKQALIYLAQSGDKALRIIRNIHLLVFFGVPHHGMHVAHLITMVKGQPNEDLIKNLAVGSKFLSDLDEQFVGHLANRKIRLISAYETCESTTAEKQPNGKYERSGKPQRLVSEDSAKHMLSEESFPIDLDHSDMVKFGYDHNAYRTVCGRLLAILAQLKKPLTNDKKDESEADRTSQVHSAQFPETGHTPSNPLKEAETNDLVRRLMPGVLNLLTYAEQEYRYHSIQEAHGSTFTWIFHNKSLGFRKWVRDGTGIYWIRGKPGSGKSTLFRHIRDSDIFRETLNSRNPRISYIDCWHFFSTRGSHLNRSIEGLLRNVLSELARRSPFLSDLIVRSLYPSPEQERNEWSMLELNDALHAVLDQRLKHIEITLYIDALDEFGGSPEDIVEWIRLISGNNQSAESLTRLRFCFSCREWDAFLTAFKNEPGFQLQKYTKDDITKYASGRLQQLSSDARYSEVASNLSWSRALRLITKLADGVFLWVKLAIDEIVKLPGPISTQQLEDSIKGFPKDLEDFYRSIVLRIAHDERQRAYVLLELIRRSTEPTTFSDLLEIESCSLGTSWRECSELLKHHRTSGRVECVDQRPEDQSFENARSRKRWYMFTSWRRRWKSADRPSASTNHEVRLVNLCGGLVECIDAPQDTETVLYVQFAHRSVQDFVSKPGFAELLLGPGLVAPENGFMFTLKHRCASNINLLGATHGLFWEIEDLAQAHEQTTGLACSFLWSLPSGWFPQVRPSDVITGAIHGKGTSAFQFAVLVGLQLLVKESIAPDNLQNLLQEHPDIFNTIAWSVGHNSSLETYGDYQPEVAQMLLDAGFSASQKLYGLTPFETLINSQHQNPTKVPTVGMIQMTRFLIEAGAQNPDEPISLIIKKSGYDSVQEVDRSQGLRAVHVARGPMLQELLDCGADPNVQDEYGNTPLDMLVASWINGQEDELLRFVPFDFGCTYRDVDLLKSRDGKLTRRGQILRLAFQLPILAEWRCVFEDIEVLDIPVEMVGVPNYSLIDSRTVDRMSALSAQYSFPYTFNLGYDGAALSELKREIREMCGDGWEPRNQ